MRITIRRAQSTVEYAVFVAIIIGALIAMQIYIKRSFQGRWKTSVDDFGQQYDPTAINSLINYATTSQSNTVVTAVPALGPDGSSGFVTNRVDMTNSTETKQENTTVGP